MLFLSLLTFISIPLIGIFFDSIIYWFGMFLMMVMCLLFYWFFLFNLFILRIVFQVVYFILKKVFLLIFFFYSFRMLSMFLLFIHLMWPSPESFDPVYRVFYPFELAISLNVFFLFNSQSFLGLLIFYLTMMLMIVEMG